MELLVDKKIKVILEITEYEGSLLVGLLRSQARDVRPARRFIQEFEPVAALLPDRLAVWEQLTEKARSSIVEARDE